MTLTNFPGNAGWAVIGYRTLTKEEIKLFEENPDLLSRPENLYLQLTHDLEWMLLALD